MRFKVKMVIIGVKANEGWFGWWAADLISPLKLLLNFSGHPMQEVISLVSSLTSLKDVCERFDWPIDGHRIDSLDFWHTAAIEIKLYINRKPQKGDEGIFCCWIRVFTQSRVAYVLKIQTRWPLYFKYTGRVRDIFQFRSVRVEPLLINGGVWLGLWQTEAGCDLAKD